jgi:hypothetical protein
MLTRLLQIRTIAGTIKRHFALLATALRTNASVDSGTEAFLFANFADRTTQIAFLLFNVLLIDIIAPDDATFASRSKSTLKM